MSIKIVDLDPEQWTRAVGIARLFLERHPNRKLGIYNGVVYSNNADPDVYVYRTKTQVVVRKTNAK
jgi:hypothetical protein